MKKALNVILVVLICVLFVSLTPKGRALANTWFFDLQKVDDATKYSTRKHVEDSCRSMISSYTSDKMTYEQYKDNENEEKQSWAEQARMRANKTAASYNEYILKNTFVWDGNIPEDIVDALEYL